MSVHGRAVCMSVCERVSVRECMRVQAVLSPAWGSRKEERPSWPWKDC